MKIALGTDHAGYRYKERTKEFLEDRGYQVRDFGTHSEDPVDYPTYILPAAEAVSEGECDRGIVLGGYGNGEAIAANKVQRIRCALCWNEETARLARQHNDANMLSIGARMISLEKAMDIVAVWLETSFEGGRHVRRVRQIQDYERRVQTRPDSPENGPGPSV